MLRLGIGFEKLLLWAQYINDLMSSRITKYKIVLIKHFAAS